MAALELASFYFDHDGLFVIPIEQLSPRGMRADFAATLRQTRGLSEAWTGQFDAAFAAYHARAAELCRRAPDTWFPPRLQHVCVARDLRAARPYTQPLQQSSWLFYQSDFDPHTSSLELSTYLFFFAERWGVIQNVSGAAIHNLAYFSLRSDADKADFREGCARTTRPDADALRAIAEALSWQPRIHHVALHPAPAQPSEPLGKLEAADLMVPLSLQAPMKALAKTVRLVSQDVVQRYLDSWPRDDDPSAADGLCRWLADTSPRVVVVGKRPDNVLWRPAQPGELSALREVLAGAPAAACDSIRADLEVIHDRSARFLAMLRDPDALPAPHALDQDAGAYIHHHERLIAYDLEHPRMLRLRAPAAPFERWMLGARTVHEWGHLAADAGMVHVPAAAAERFEAAKARVAALLDEAIAAAPMDLAHTALDEAKLLGGDARRPGAALRDAVLARMDDYQANLLARRVLSPEEMETYARANVVTLFRETQVGPWLKLARHAYEFQYLRLTRLPDPMAYFLDATWFRQHFIDIGLVDESRTRALFDAMGEVCACYAVDDSFFVDARRGA